MVMNLRRLLALSSKIVPAQDLVWGLRCLTKGGSNCRQGHCRVVLASSLKSRVPWRACDEWPLERLMTQRPDPSEAMQMHQAASHRHHQQFAILLARALALLPLHGYRGQQKSEPFIVLDFKHYIVTMLTLLGISCSLSWSFKGVAIS